MEQKKREIGELDEDAIPRMDQMVTLRGNMVEEMIRLYEAGETYQKIALRFNCSHNTVRDYIAGKVRPRRCGPQGPRKKVSDG